MSEFLKLDNRVVIKLKIVPVSPLLILDGREMEKINNQGEDAEKNKNLFLRDSSGQIYIPGSTLKGLFRNKFIDIYGEAGAECIDKVFGHKEENGKKGNKAKIFLQDGYLINPNKKNIIQVRDCAPVNHFSGGNHNIVRYEYTMDPFICEIILNNATIKELQGIYFIIRDSINREIRIGNSKTRGFGEIRFEIEELIFEKYRGKKMVVDDRFFKRDEKLSQKLGNTYFKEAMLLKSEYKEVDIENPNEFIAALFSEVK